MKVISRAGRLKKLGAIENGCLFKLNLCYYIATDEFNSNDNRRICVNAESGVLIPIDESLEVETLDYATIELTGRG